jgi:hypothetical protein
MLGTIGGFIGRVSVYITAGLGLVALYFLWVAFREWRASGRTMFGVERDIAESEMIGAIVRAGVVVLVAVLVFGAGLLGRQADSDDEKAQSTRAPTPTFPPVATVAPGTLATSMPTTLPTDPPQPAVTDVPQLPPAPTEALPVEPTPQIATVVALGGVWLRDAPNGGTIALVPQDSVVELLQGLEAAGDYDWQQVRVISVPPGSGAQGAPIAQVDQQGWVAAEYLQANP